ncbi:hypothetical protein ACEWY4_005389 [Coilia grayii]|uniref:Fibrinogen C-terminal domain-containing protein n=1 Tax=Coilia grayii TaxID=363190 RepID=A0ABD1KI75_9TELE
MSSMECTTERFSNCREVFNKGFNESGVYIIHLFRGSVKAYCDMDTDNGGWMVIQRRVDGNVNFYRPWDQYRQGFGDRAGEHWLGLQSLYMLTAVKRHELRVEMEDFEGNKVFAKYSSFLVGSEGDGYKLSVSGFTDGGAGDSLSYHNGQKFSTFNNDNSGSKCARLNLGAFWYKPSSCHTTNPNGIYRWGSDSTISNIGVAWKAFKGLNYSLKSITMMIRPVS